MFDFLLEYTNKIKTLFTISIKKKTIYKDEGVGLPPFLFSYESVSDGRKDRFHY